MSENSQPKKDLTAEMDDLDKFDRRSVPRVQGQKQVSAYPEFDGLTVDEMNAKFEIMKKMDAFAAKKAYVQAMANFKANPPKIFKDKHVEYEAKGGLTSYDHASLANITGTISQGLGAEGLTASWKTDQKEAMVEVTCTITHSMGHGESSTLKASPDQSGGKNNIQAIGSTISYLQRYTLLSLTGLATYDMDNDGRGNNTAEPVETISEKQFLEIKEMISAVGDEEAPWLEWMGVESIETIPANQYNKIMAALKARLKK